jgi:hypothetical protein
LSKFNLILIEVQLHMPSSSTACEKQFKCYVFFRAKILPIKIVSLYLGCASKSHKYLTYNDMSLLSLVHGVMPPLNHHSHTKFKSLAYGRRSYCLLLLKIIPKPCIIWKHHLEIFLRNLNIFQMVYHLLHSDLSFRNNCKTVHAKLSNPEIRIIYIQNCF